MPSLLFASASSQWLRLDSQDQLRRWSAGDFGAMTPLIWMGSIDDLFLLSLNVVGVAGQQQQQSSAQGLGWPSCGRSAGGGGIAGGPEGLRAVGAAVCARAGVIHHPQLQPVGQSLSSCSSACWSMDLYVELSESSRCLVLNAITNPSIHSTRKTKPVTLLFRTSPRVIAHP